MIRDERRPGETSSPTTAVPPRITWLGHATTVIEIGGVRVMTDPALTDRLAHLRRHHRVDAAALAAPDLILISHLHMDHLHVPSLRHFGKDVLVIVPRGAAAFLRRRGFRQVHETDAGRTTDVAGLTVETVPAAHSGRRGPHTRIAADAVGYVLHASDGSVYFPGDTDLFPEMAQLGEIDIALFPIGGWGRTLGEGHLDPERAMRATELVQPRLVVPIHWGTYSPIGLRRGAPAWLREPARRLEVLASDAGDIERLHVLDPGESLSISQPVDGGRPDGQQPQRP